MGTMRTRDPLRLLRALRRRRREKKRRNKCETTDSQEELPNHLRNCSNYSQHSSFDCALKKQIFRFHSFLDIYVLFEIEKYVNFIFKRCLSSYQLSKFYQRPTKDSFLSVPFDPLQPHVPWAFPKFNKDEKLSINMNLPFSPIEKYSAEKSISLGWLHSPALGWSLSGKLLSSIAQRNPTISLCS